MVQLLGLIQGIDARVKLILLKNSGRSSKGLSGHFTSQFQFQGVAALI